MSPSVVRTGSTSADGATAGGAEREAFAVESQWMEHAVAAAAAEKRVSELEKALQEVGQAAAVERVEAEAAAMEASRRLEAVSGRVLRWG